MFLEVRIPSRASWSWRKILDSRKWCKGLFTHKIGNGERTSLWFDYWLPNGERVYDTITASTVASAGLSWNAKVAAIIRNGVWVFPPCHLDLQRIWNNISFNPRSHCPDTIVWKGHSSGKFSIASAWNWVRSKKEKYHLYCLIWYPNYVPRYSLTLWLAALGKLSTTDRPHMQAITVNRQCVLCDLEPESHDHIFFSCPYSATVWSNLTAQSQLHWPRLNWPNLLHWAGLKFKGRKGYTNLIAKHTLATTVYFIWT